MLQIPLQAVPSQQLQVVLGTQNCVISIYQKDQGIFVDLTSNGVVISQAVIALDVTPLTFNYSGFIGNLVFTDTLGNSDPVYTGLGNQYQLIYLDTSEVANVIFH
jgi:hypothetical protein